MRFETLHALHELERTHLKAQVIRTILSLLASVPVIGGLVLAMAL